MGDSCPGETANCGTTPLASMWRCTAGTQSASSAAVAALAAQCWGEAPEVWLPYKVTTGLPTCRNTEH